MEQNKDRYERFIQQICLSGAAWTLENDEGSVTTDSNEYENEDGEAFALFCFWSGRREAAACAIGEWAGYRPAEIPLGKLIEDWCVWMSDDEMLAGVEFDTDLVGIEQEPLQLVLDIANELERTKKQVHLDKFKHIDELTDIIKCLQEEAAGDETDEATR
ncbi:MAG: DUF2750 domain-containing protein [Odoribacteraceae bacterium]|jgi:hypothetical protein|nr:DUF2750 domain-containing protein [Odoribacteraceae bacterium]